MDDRERKINELADSVLQLSRNTLLVNLRFMDAAISRLSLYPTEAISFGTEGVHIAYRPVDVLRAYRSEREAPVRNYLHLVLHCVFRHMFIHPLVDQPAWDLACDIAVEHTIAGLRLRSAECARAKQQSNALAELEEKIGMLTAERIYGYLSDKKIHPARLAELRGLFYADDHSLWYLSPEQQRKQLGLSGTDNSDEDEDGSIGRDAVVLLELEGDWKGVSERMQLEMETFAWRQGTVAGNLMQNLKEVNRERYDYAAFLKKFAVSGEVMKINDEEFDYVFYTYGLRLYRNLPLIEPLEYKDVKRICEFVIAIDTSGSVAGDIVQAFVQKTYNILQSTESFFSKINLHIIQCDADIQDHVKITTRKEFDDYLKTMKIRGLGGTDFRPVFSLVDELVQQREFTNLKGLIYFTDGYGIFPAQKPGYDTAFVFLEDGEYGNPEVPPWAIKLVLRKDEI